MANIKHWPNGFGGTTGDAPLATAKDIWHYADASTDVVWVDSSAADDTGDGTEDDPYQKFATAVAAVGDGDVIVIKSGHAETITANVALASRIYVIGIGVGSARPTFTPNLASNAEMFTLTACCHFHGIRVAASSQANTGDCIDASAAGAQGSRFNYCEFTSGDDDDGIKLNMNTSASWVSNSTFISSGTTYDARPAQAFKGVRLMTDCTITGSTYGWTTTNTLMFGWGNTAAGEVAIGATASANTSIIQCDVTEGAYFDTSSIGAGDQQYSIYPEGLGQTGHQLVSGRGLYIAGESSRIWWVNSVGGVDGAGYGRSKNAPFDTLKYAIDTGGATGLVVVVGGHAETTTAEITVGAGTFVVGTGTGTGRPQMTRNHTAVGISFSSANGGLIANMIWKEDTQANSNATVSLAAAGTYADGVDFECNEHQNGSSILVGAAHCIVDTCLFTSIAADVTDRPAAPFDTTEVDNVVMVNCTFDGGQFGWTTYCADIGPNFLTIENLSLLRGSIFAVDIYGTAGYFVATDALVQVSTATGGSGITTELIV